MKKMIGLLLVLVMALGMVACKNGQPAGNTSVPAKTPLTDGLATVIEKITPEQPVEFAPMTLELDLNDTSEENLGMLKYYTGLDSADQIKEAAAFEPMISSIAFSMVLVRVSDAAETETVAEQMKAGIDPRKWFCVEANDILVAGYCDVIMFIMLDSSYGMTAQSFVDAFQTVCGAELDFVLK